MITRGELGWRLNVVRRMLGLTQGEFGLPANINKGIMSKVECGTRGLEGIEAAKLAYHHGFCIKALYAIEWDPAACLAESKGGKGNKK